MKEYKPRESTAMMLDTCMEYMNSLEYRVSGRHLFYRMLQDNIYSKKCSYIPFMAILSRARKSFYKEWRPYTLEDNSRRIILNGYGAMCPEDVVVTDYICLDRFKDQDYFVVCCFEAIAMAGQFEHITMKSIPLFPFAGQYSIEPKWKLAKFLEEANDKYEGEKPIIVTYFGDADKYGRQIPKSAFSDVRKWCDVDFEIVYGGLTIEQAEKFKLPMNPDKKDEYQWESLCDLEARELIEPILYRYIDKDILLATIKREREIIEADKAGK